MTTSNYLELEGALGALRDVLVETLLGIVRQLEGALAGAAGAWHQEQQQQEQPTVPTAQGGHPALRGASRDGGPNGAAGTRGGSALTHCALQASAGVVPRRRAAEMLRASERFKMRSELLGVVEGTERPGPRC